MIRSFNCKETEGLWNGKRSKKLPGDIQQRALRKLRMLDASSCLDDLRNPPGNHLEELKGDLKGLHSIRVNKQWRICFKWKDNEAHNVFIGDYHA